MTSTTVRGSVLRRITGSVVSPPPGKHPAGGKRGGVAASGWSVLDSDGNAFAVTLAVLDSDGNSFTVSSAVLDSDGNSFAVI